MILPQSHDAGFAVLKKVEKFNPKVWVQVIIGCGL